VWESREGLPGRACGLVRRRNLDGTEPTADLVNAPADTPLATLATVGAPRWPIETAFPQAKGDAGLDEYEVRSWTGWPHHIARVLLATAFLLQVRREWGKKLPGVTIPHVTRGLREVQGRRHWTREDLAAWLHGTQTRNLRAKRTHAARRRARQRDPSL
jgi:hypothetical protein